MSDTPLPPAQPKKETVRISLPPPPGAPAGGVKRETVRISLPSAPGTGGVTPKLPPPPRPAASASPAPATPLMPSAPKLPPPPVVSTPATSSPLPPPRPGTAPLVKPAAPSAPATPSSPAAPTSPAKAASPVGKPAVQPDSPLPVVQKPASAAKKETARIQLPPEPKALPKATIKLEQTQPMSARPTTPAPQRAAIVQSQESGDPLLAFSVFAFIGSVVALVVQVLAFLGGSQ